MNEMNDLLLKICILLIIPLLILVMKIEFSFNEIRNIDRKNAKLEQQVIDYKWQLEQVEYIMKYQKGE